MNNKYNIKEIEALSNDTKPKSLRSVAFVSMLKYAVVVCAFFCVYGFFIFYLYYSLCYIVTFYESYFNL